MEDCTKLEALKEEMINEGLGCVRVRYLGDSMVLLTEEEDEDISKLIEENIECLELSHRFPRLYVISNCKNKTIEELEEWNETKWE